MANPTTEIRRDGGDHPQLVARLPMTNAKIWKGALVGLNASGHVANLSGVTNPFVGEARETVDNSAGSAGGKSIDVITQGLRKMAVTGVDGPDDVGKAVYSADGNGPTLTGTSAEFIGRVFQHISGTSCLVHLMGRGAQLSAPVVNALTAITDNSGGATADGTIGAVTAPTALTHTVGTADGTVDDVGAAFVQATLNNNFKELTARQAENRTAIIALTDAVKELSTALNEVRARGV